MKIAVISDTHGNRTHFKKAAEQMSDCSYIIHLGDGIDDAAYFSEKTGKKVLCVKGNNDYSTTFDNTLIIEESGLRIFCTHGHKYSVYMSMLRLSLAAQEAQAQVALYGHTHRPAAFFENSIQFINPGSLGEPRGLSKPGFVILNIEHGYCSPKFIEIK